MGSKQLVALLTVAAVAGLGAPSALADGDPASDTLLAQTVFIPIQQPAGAEESHLRATVNQTQAGGYRVRVAVIASRADLGLEPQFFGRPQAYATFLARELPRFYGPKLRTGVLIAMPSGFGIAGKSFSPAERQALSQITIPPGRTRPS